MSTLKLKFHNHEAFLQQKRCTFILLAVLIPIISSESEPISDSDFEAIKIFKCSQSVQETFLLVPNTLRFSQSQDGLPKNGYNFTLVTFPEKSRKECFSQPFHLHLNVTSTMLKGNEGLLQSKKENLFTPFGFLSSNSTYFNPNNYCISRITDSEITAQVCLNFQEQQPPTIPKCCPMGTAYQIATGKCVAITIPDWLPNFYLEDSFKNQSVFHPNYNRKPTVCDSYKSILPYQLGPAFADYGFINAVRFSENGEIWTRVTGNHPWVRMTGNFCTDGILTTNVTEDDTLESLTYLGNKFDSQRFVVITCIPPNTEEIQFALVYLVVLSASALILLVINLVYTVIWQLENVHGWTIHLFCTCMFMWFVSLVVGLAYNIWGHNYYGSVLCQAIGIFSHSCYINTFSSMVVLNFDLYSTIGSMTALSLRSQGKRRFFFYCCFTFGIPIIILAVSIFMEFNFGLFDDRVVRPQYGRTRCNVDVSALLYYGSIPSGILFCVSLVFSILTLKTLWKFREETRRVKVTKMNQGSSRESSNKRMWKSQLSRMWKLFILMGISWIFDIISAIAAGPQITWYWASLDFYNILQAIGLFWIFVCKNDVKDKLGQNIPFLKKSGCVRRDSCCFVKQRKKGNQRGFSSSSPSTSFSHISQP